jgi:hypothetical protein
LRSIEIVEIIWKHHEEEALQQATMSNGEEEEWTTNTMDVGGATFDLVKSIIIPTTATSSTSQQEYLLVAAGKSYLSYLYMGICSTVLYLDIATIDNSAVLFLNNNNDNKDMPIALEIYYHKPARAVDLAWATNKFIEANLVSTSNANNVNNSKCKKNNNKNKISNLSTKYQIYHQRYKVN